jgi:4'-phosphopantetheinyl transferase
VEHIRPDIEHLELARANFCEGELAILQNLGEAHRSSQFFKYWTRKEAVIKALGLGLALSPQNVCVDAVSNDQCEVEWQYFGQSGWVNVRDLSLDDGYAAAVATTVRDSVVSIFPFESC